jgi:hypothetical protein
VPIGAQLNRLTAGRQALAYAVRWRTLEILARGHPEFAWVLLPRPDPGWEQAAQARQASNFAAHAARRGVSLATYTSEVRRRLKTWMSTAEVRVRMRLPFFELFIQEGRFRTQFEVPHSAGALHRSRRMILESVLLGIPASCPARHGRSTGT